MVSHERSSEEVQALPLLLAAGSGDLDELNDLIARGMDVNARDQRGDHPGWTVLMTAAEAGHLEVVEALLAAGAVVNRSNRDGEFVHGSATFYMNEGVHGQGRFLTSIEDPEELAYSMYDLCSDIVDQGTGTVEALAEQLATSDQLYFWWD